MHYSPIDQDLFVTVHTTSISKLFCSRIVGRLMRKAVGQNTSVIDSKGKGGGIPISVD